MMGRPKRAWLRRSMFSLRAAGFSHQLSLRFPRTSSSSLATTGTGSPSERGSPGPREWSASIVVAARRERPDCVRQLNVSPPGEPKILGRELREIQASPTEWRNGYVERVCSRDVFIKSTTVMNVVATGREDLDRGSVG